MLLLVFIIVFYIFESCKKEESMNKSVYFSEDKIDQESIILFEKLKSSINIREKFALNRNSALIVLDVQKYFTDKLSHAFVPSSPAIIQNINRLIVSFKKLDLPIFYTKHFNSNNYSNMMNKWWNKKLEKESSLFDIEESIIVGSSSIIIEKEYYDAFYLTELDRRLNDLGVDSLVVCGLMTHLCCETTIRSAFVRGYKSFFVFDATATYNVDFHCASFLNLSHGFSIPKLTNNVISEIENE